MQFFSKLLSTAAAILLLCSGAVAQQDSFFHCEMDGDSATYHQDEVPRMKSLGAICTPLANGGGGGLVLCSVGSVQSVFSAQDAAQILDRNMAAVCEVENVLVTSASVTTSSSVRQSTSVSVASGSATVAVVAGSNKPAFGMQKKTVVYFNLGSSALVSSEYAKVAEFARYYGNGGHRITITGHTDSSGSSAFNHTLSIKRAGTVRDALIMEGVSMDDVLSVSVLGEESLRYQTSNGRRFLLNRAVELRAYK